MNFNHKNAEILNLIHAGGGRGVIYDPLLLSPVIAVTKGQTKKAILPNLFLRFFFQISSSHKTKMRVKKHQGGRGSIMNRVKLYITHLSLSYDKLKDFLKQINKNARHFVHFREYLYPPPFSSVQLKKTPFLTCRI